MFKFFREGKITKVEKTSMQFENSFSKPFKLEAKLLIQSVKGTYKYKTLNSQKRPDVFHTLDQRYGIICTSWVSYFMYDVVSTYLLVPSLGFFSKNTDRRIEFVDLINCMVPFSVFCSPEPKVQVSFSDHYLSIVHRCRWWCCCCKLFTFSSSSPEPLG